MPEFVFFRPATGPTLSPRSSGRRRALVTCVVGLIAASLLVPVTTATAAPSPARSSGTAPTDTVPTDTVPTDAAEPESAAPDVDTTDGSSTDGSSTDGSSTAGSSTEGAAGEESAARRGGGRTFTVLAEGLTGNKALGMSRDGSLLLGGEKADGTGVLQKYVRSGRSAGTVTTLTDLPAPPTDVGAAGWKGAWVLFGASAPPEEGRPPSTEAPANRLYRWTPRGGLVEIADLGAYAVAHPDPADLEGNPGESNAYGLQPLSDGSVLVADAAANALRRVWSDGRIVTVARFPVQTISTAHIPDPTLPPELPAESVPTTVTLGRDGAWYVGELKGFPFTPGTSKVWRIAAGSRDVDCDAAAPSRACAVHLDGLTAIIDMAADRRGRLGVLELAKGGLAALEGDPSAPPPPGALVQVDRSGRRTELAEGRITLPGGIVADPFGRTLFVTDFQLVPGGGRLLRIGC